MTITTEHKIRWALSDLWFAHPSGVSTFSPCECGRSLARGGRMCHNCAEERLAALVGRELADEYHRSVISLRKLEMEMIDGTE